MTTIWLTQNPFTYKNYIIRLESLYDEGHSEFYFLISDFHGKGVKTSENFSTIYKAYDSAIDFVDSLHGRAGLGRCKYCGCLSSAGEKYCSQCGALF